MSFSFIIPIYNTKIIALEKCLNSIFNQNISDYEIIIVNDGSTDLELNNYCKNNISKRNHIKYCYEENSGSAVARNTALDKVSKEYIIFVDSDDELEDGFINNIKTINLGDISVFNYSYIYKESVRHFSCCKEQTNLSYFKKDIFSNIMFYPGKMNNFMFGAIWGKIFSSKYIKSNGIHFVPRLRKAQDRVFMLYAINNTDNIVYYPIDMYKYKMNQGSITHKMNLKMIDYYSYLYEEMSKFAINNNLNDNVTKFLSYNIINELLPLTIFNINYDKKYMIIREKLIDLINKYNVSIIDIKYGDIPTIKGKIKLFLYRSKSYYVLYRIFIAKQKKELKKMMK